MLPSVFVGHGGGPLPLMKDSSHEDVLRTWAPGSCLHRALHDHHAMKAVVIVSAHHESGDGGCLIGADEQPSLLYDYEGFPAETYQYKMPNPSSPQIASNVAELLSKEGIPHSFERGRGRDHGVFVPLLGLGLLPEVPVVQVSMRGPAHDYDHKSAHELADAHWELGKALRPLREEGVLIIGSGMSDHGSVRRGRTTIQAEHFDQYLHRLARGEDGGMRNCFRHKDARACHPTPDHLLPLVVCAGAADPGERCTVISHQAMGTPASHFVWGQ